MKPVFIHISKNAGTSVVRAAGEHIFNPGHHTAASWVAVYGQVAPMFAVIRNPYDRVVSEYFFRKQRYYRGDRTAHLANLNKSFEEWTVSTYGEGEFCTREFFNRNDIDFNSHNMVGDTLRWFISQTQWLCDENGDLLVDDLLRFENLDEDLALFFKKYRIPAGLDHHNASSRRSDYRGYYSKETRELISEYYADDFQNFGYTFGG